MGELACTQAACWVTVCAERTIAIGARILVETSEPSRPNAIEPLSRRVARGTLWLAVSRFAVRLIDLVNTVILARILLPQDFGLVALATAVSGYLEMVSQFGIELALIRFRGTDRAL